MRSQSSTIRPNRFLDVGSSSPDGFSRLRRVDLDSSQPYVTLSYVWGQDQAARTTRSTLAKHEAGIPIQSLPNTIKDAITITRLLGVDLLWVDSLCIVQDDPDELLTDIADMSFYYGNSLLTISAASASSCDEGFLKQNWNENILENHLSLPFDDGRSGLHGARLHLLPPTTSPREPIDYRAWTLQEGLLSNRILSFGPNSISWSCLSSEFGALHIGPLRRTFRVARPRSQSFRPEPHMRVGAEHLSSNTKILHNILSYNGRTHHELRNILNFWDEIVHEYTSRALSDPADKLSAISGVAREFSWRFSPPTDPEMPRYLAGMWWSDLLPLQLLWQVVGPCRRRPVYVAPSWSWASVTGPLDRQVQELILNYRPLSLRHTRITACQIVRQSLQAPYGPVTSGYLTISGRTFKPDIISLRDHGIRTALDEVGGPPTPELASDEFGHLCLLEITCIDDLHTEVSKEVTNRPRPRGLILRENEEGSYRRLGLFYHSTNGIPWEVNTLQII